MQIELHDEQGHIWSGPFQEFADANAEGFDEDELIEIRGQLESDGFARVAGWTGLQFEARVAA